jgi:hypothetical protein
MEEENLLDNPGTQEVVPVISEEQEADAIFDAVKSQAQNTIQEPAQSVNPTPIQVDLAQQVQKDSFSFDDDYVEHYQNSEDAAADDVFDSIKSEASEMQQIQLTPPQQEQQTPQYKSFSEFSNAIGKDAAVGVIQAPRRVLRGAIKGVNGMINFVEGVSDYLPTISLLTQEGDLGVPRVIMGDERDKREAARINKQNADTGDSPVNFEDVGRDVLAVPDAPKSQSATGEVIEDIAQFAIGFKGVDKAAKLLNVGKATAGTAGVVNNMIKGGLADIFSFGEQEERLSNVIQKIPGLKNPVTEYLQADPEDSFAEAKFKQFVEGVGLGAAGEVLLGGIRLYKQGKTAVQEAKFAGLKAEDLEYIPSTAKTGQSFQKEALKVLGDVDDPRLIISEVKELDPVLTKVEAAAKSTKEIDHREFKKIMDTSEIAHALPDSWKNKKEIKINFARIEGPDDIKQAMQDLANDPKLLGDVQTARRGVVSDEALLKNAEDIDGFSTLMERRVGQAFNDSQTVAARKIYYDATDRLIEAAKKAGSVGASSYDQYAFRRMMAVHHAVQQEVLGARAEAARALRAWSIPLGGGNMDRLRAVETALDNFGGVEATQDLAKKIALVTEGGKLNTDQINQIVKGGALARTGKALQEVWQLGLLTSPRTHIVNAVSNTLTGITLGVERFAQVFMKDSPVEMREAIEYFAGYTGSFRQALSNSAQAWRTGQTGFGIGKIEAPFERASSREVLDPNGKAGMFSKAMDWYGAALNKYVGGALAASDEFAKTILYNAQIRALAARQGAGLGLKGDALAKHIADSVSNPPPMVRADALEFADYGTYTNASLEAVKIQGVLTALPGSRFIVPFVKTPVNVFKYDFSRTPLGYLSSKTREDIAAGGARKSAAFARLGMGSSVMMLGTDMAMNGEITGGGPLDTEVRNRLMSNGWQPYSIKIDDTYYSYARLGPLATWLGISADMTEILSNYEHYDIDAQDEIEELGVAAVTAIANQVVGKTFMSGIADITQVLSDSKRHSGAWLSRMAGSVVPNVVADIERSFSPEREQVFNMMDAIKARIPGLSDSVPKRHNAYGEVIKAYYPSTESKLEAWGERVMQIFNPVYFSDKDAPSQKLDQWFLTTGIKGPSMPDKRVKFEVPGDFTGQTVSINLRDYPEIHSRMVEKRSEVKLPQYNNVTMKEHLRALVNQEIPYSKLFFMKMAKDKDAQEKYIAQVINSYDKQIRKELLEEFPVLSQIIAQERQEQLPQMANRGAEGLVRTRAFP